MRKLLLLLSLFCVMNVSWAADWQGIVHDSSGNWYYDQENIIRRSDSASVWVKIDFYKPKVNYVQRRYYIQELQQLKFDCSEHTFITYDVIDYDSEGSVVSTVNLSNDGTHGIVPGSMSDTIMRLVCKP